MIICIIHCPDRNKDFEHTTWQPLWGDCKFFGGDLFGIRKPESLGYFVALLVAYAPTLSHFSRTTTRYWQTQTDGQSDRRTQDHTALAYCRAVKIAVARWPITQQDSRRLIGGFFKHACRYFLSADKNRPIFQWHTTDFCPPIMSADFCRSCVIGLSRVGRKALTKSISHHTSVR